MQLDRGWQAIVADDDVRRTWLDATDPDPATITDGPDPDLEATVPVWEPITVPGHWRNDDHFAASDGPLLYRNRFTHPAPEPGRRLWLRFDGVFYQGDVWLDGGYVGDTEGYFFPHTFEVTEAFAAQEEHTLGIEVTCSPQRDPKNKRNITGVFQHWDAADLDGNPGGIWRPVTVEETGPVRIRHLRVICREANETRANVRFRAVLDAADAIEVTLRSSVGDTTVDDTRRLAAGENQVEWQVRVDDPTLWWPHALGDPHLYDVAVEVVPHLDDEATSDAVATDDAAADDAGAVEDPAEPPARLGPVSHRLTRRIGLRQVELKGWVLHVNGERLFTKGVNLGPTRMDLAEASPADLRRDVELARDLGLDLIRIHAHITRPEVYEAADELGMLIWQDFPLQWGYARTVRKQAIRQGREAVDLLGHHPSLVVWCAHNAPASVGAEPGAAGVGNDGGRTRLRYLADQELPSWNRTILDRSVKRSIDKADGSRPVIPHSGVLPHPPMLDGTDSHLYFGWYHGDERDLDGLARTMPRLVRFVSQFGAQSVPDTASFAEPERWPDLDWDGLARHHGLQKEIFDRRVPPVDHTTFDSWRTATQRYQADLLRNQIETLRRIKYRPTGGFAVFLLADAQPAISWSLLDHDRVPKAAFEAVREACRPVVVTADRLPAEAAPGLPVALDVHVVNDLRTAVDGIEVTAVLTWTGGEQRWRFGGSVPADAVTRVGTLQIEVPDAPGPLTLELTLDGDALPDGPQRRVDTTRITR